LLERRTKRADFRDTDKSLDSFDFDFNKKMNRRIIYELAAGHFIAKHEDALFLGPPGTGKSHLAQAIGRCAIQQGHRILYREAHVLIEQIADATIDGTRKELMEELATVPLLIRRRPRDAQAPAHGGRGPPGTGHAPLRARQHSLHFKSPGGGLGQGTWRRCRRRRHARPPPAPRASPQVRPPKLAHQDRRGLAGPRGYE
jgi:hypothetical protein